MPVVIEPLTSPDDIDGILAVEDASFTNPWTREMYLSELANVGVAYFLLARDETRQIVGLFLRGFELGRSYFENFRQCRLDRSHSC